MSFKIFGAKAKHTAAWSPISPVPVPAPANTHPSDVPPPVSSTPTDSGLTRTPPGSHNGIDNTLGFPELYTQLKGHLAEISTGIHSADQILETMRENYFKDLLHDTTTLASPLPAQLSLLQGPQHYQAQGSPSEARIIECWRLNLSLDQNYRFPKVRDTGYGWEDSYHPPEGDARTPPTPFPSDNEESDWETDVKSSTQVLDSSVPGVNPLAKLTDNIPEPCSSPSSEEYTSRSV